MLTSVYCLLAFLPYTYIALIKAPAYEWTPWFVHHHSAIYWTLLLAVAASRWPDRKRPAYPWLFGGLVLAGAYLTVRAPLPDIQNDWTAYVWSLAALLPLLLGAVLDIWQCWPADESESSAESLLLYSSAVLTAVLISLLYAAGGLLHIYVETRSLNFHANDVELLGWSLLSHVLVGVILISILNLIRIVAQRTAYPRTIRLASTGALVFGALWIGLLRFLEDALSFEGWPSYLSAGALAAALTLFGFSVALPFLPTSARVSPVIASLRKKLLLSLACVGLAATVIALPTLIAGGDWNGILQHSFAVIFWIALSWCVYQLRPRRTTYSVVTIIAVVLLLGCSYKALQASAIFWGKPLGSTDDEVAHSMEKYAVRDASFSLAHGLLGNSRREECGNLCRILREHTNIRDAHANTDIQLVDQLVATSLERPNIFIFVIDSLRPDYLGAYNTRADFSPNIDAFAKDSVALRNVYTQYAGTTLSEPAIWSGALLLHAHYMQPFSRVNSLEKLANTDGYQMIVSYDTVLSQLLSPSDNLVKLDTDKPLWNGLEICSTVQQTQQALDSRADKNVPVLFYSQPMNVHQFARNNMPGPTAANWQIRQGFNNRIAYEVHQVDNCMGNFFSYLKARRMYDNSIIILTSDHGDATGEFGRYSHSTSIYPEIVRVPLIVHLPAAMRAKMVYDDEHLSALTDITPSLYYLLGHQPIRSNPLFGRPLFMKTADELKSRQRDELFLASDERPVYGLLTENGHFLYVTYDSPAESFLFDLANDPDAEHNRVNPALKQRYDEQIILHLQTIADFYGYKPGVGSLLATTH